MTPAQEPIVAHEAWCPTSLGPRMPCRCEAGTSTPGGTSPSAVVFGDWVPDLPCPKCGSNDVHFRYAKACGYKACADETHHERFERFCRRCGYEWATYDVNSGGAS